MQSLWYIDFTLTSVSAHAYNHSYALRQAAKDAEVEFLVFGSEKAKAAVSDHHKIFFSLTTDCNQDLGLPLFGRRFFIGQLLDFMRANYRAFFSMKSISSTHKIPCAILFGTTDFRHLVGIGIWALRYRTRLQEVNIHITLMDDLSIPINTAFRYLRRPFWDVAFAVIKLAGHHTKISFLSDTADRVRAIKEMGVPCDDFPLPSSVGISRRAHVSDKKESPAGLMIGNLRAERGVDLLVGALNLLKESLKKREFLIRINLACEDKLSPEEEGLYSRLLTLQSVEGIALSFDTLSAEDYQQSILEADFVLLPYSQSAYKNKSSGILIEALGAGKPVVTTSNTWLAEIVKNETLGTLCVDGDISSLATAITKIVQDFSFFSKQAREFAIKKEKSWSPSCLLNRLLDEKVL